MLTWFRQLDELLRGRRTSTEQLTSGQIDLPLRPFVILAIVLGAAYGFFMGWFGLMRPDGPEYRQLIASVLKMPALFILTLVVTFPSLYVFNALVGCRLSFTGTLRLLVAAILVNLAVAASFGPILGFFTVSTTSYAFMVLLNVALLTISGVVGLGFLLHALRRLAWATTLPITGVESPPGEPLPAGDQPPADAPPTQPQLSPEQPYGLLEAPPGGYPMEALGSARFIFQIWVVIFALVGAQMGWILRPFIGSPSMPFTWFRARQGNFFEAVFTQFQNLLTGG
jgi:hypothetical protein